MASLLQRFHDEASQIYGVPWANLRWRGFGFLLDGLHQPPIRNIVNCSLRGQLEGRRCAKERGFDHHLMRSRPPAVNAIEVSFDVDVEHPVISPAPRNRASHVAATLKAIGLPRILLRRLVAAAGLRRRPRKTPPPTEEGSDDCQRRNGRLSGVQPTSGRRTNSPNRCHAMYGYSPTTVRFRLGSDCRW